MDRNCFKAIFLSYTLSESAPSLFLNSQAVFLSHRPYLLPLSSFLLFLSLCWGCFFSLSLCHHSSGMSVAEWFSVLPSRSVNPLFTCTEQNLKNMPGFYILPRVTGFGSSQCLHHPALSVFLSLPDIFLFFLPPITLLMSNKNNLMLA